MRINIEVTFESNVDALPGILCDWCIMKNGTCGLNKGFNTNKIELGDLVNGQYILCCDQPKKSFRKIFNV